MSRTSGWGYKSRLAGLALLLGLFAVPGDPYGRGSVRLDTRELAALVEGEQDHVTVSELADWIVQGRNDYRLLDVRSPEDYAEYHIPSAESVQLTELADYPLLRNEKIVLYSDGGMHSAQAWFLLKASGYPGVYILLYGLEEWKSRILFPALATGASQEQIAEFRRRSELSRFFGGSPQIDAVAGERAEVVMPTAPAAPQAPVVQRKRKRKEGC